MNKYKVIKIIVKFVNFYKNIKKYRNVYESLTLTKIKLAY